MSERSKQHRARRAKEQERQAKGVIKWMIIVLVLIALAWIVYISAML